MTTNSLPTHTSSSPEKKKCLDCYSVLVVMGSFFLHFSSMGMVQSFGILYVEILEYFGSNNAASSWIPSLSSGLMFALGPVSGILETKFGCRFVAVTGSLFMTVGMASSMFVSSVYMLYLTYGVITGIGFGLVHLVGYTIVNLHITKRRSMAMGFGSAGGGVGTMVFPLLSNYLLKCLGWKWTFLILSGICSVGIVFGAFFKSGEQSTTEDNKEKKETFKDIRKASKAMLSQPGFILFLLSGCFVALAYFVPFVMTPEMAILRGISKDDTAILITVAGITSIIGRISIGLISESKHVDRTLLNGVILSIGGVATFGCVHLHSLYAFLIYGAVLGLFTGTFGVMQPIVVPDLVGEDNFGLALGYMTFFHGIAFTVGPPIAGWIADVSGDYVLAYYYAGFFLVAGGLFSCLVWVHKRLTTRKHKYNVSRNNSTADSSEHI